MKHLKLILIIFLILSCNKEKKANYNSSSLIGNWSSVKDGFYQEFFFDRETMYSYDPNSGNVAKYHYKIKNDSIYRYYIHPKVNKEYKFYDRVISINSSKVKLKNRILDKIDEKNTLDLFVSNVIDEKKYYTHCINRKKERSFDSKESYNINLDSI